MLLASRMRSAVLACTGPLLLACTPTSARTVEAAPGYEFAGPELADRRSLVDIDNDGEEDVFYISQARTTTPKSTDYAAYFHQVLDKYDCGVGYFGYECAKRLCPFGESWTVDAFMASSPSDELYTPWGRSTEGAMHSYQECSGKGICNRDTGKCKCLDGFHGKGCRHKTCPNDCGDHGVCQPAYIINPDYVADIPETSQFWDRKRSFRCECDYGYTGVDCSDRICPVGLDPVNAYDIDCDPEVDRSADFFGVDQQVIQFPDDMPNDQWFYLDFETLYGGKPFRTHPIHYDSTHLATLVGDIQVALEALPNQAMPSCQTRLLDNDVGYSATVLVAFSDETMAGRQQLLSCVAPSTTDASSCESGTQPKIKSVNPTGVECEVSYYNDESEIYTPYECSSRGECDRTNGKCDCHSGFEGSRCEEMFSFY